MCASYLKDARGRQTPKYEAPAAAQYCLLRQDCRFEAYSALHVYGVQPEHVTRGVLARQVQEPVRITLSAYGTARSDLLEAPCLVLSTAARHALERAGVGNVTYHRAELRGEYSERVIDGYWVANVLGLVSCVDSARARWEGGEHGAGRLLQFEIDVKRSYGLAMFRLAEEPSLVVVSARVRRALEAARLRGLVFQAPSSYDGYPIDSSRTSETADAPQSEQD